MLVDRAVASGDIRLDIDPLDLLRALAGVAGISSVPGWEESAKRLVDILIAGVRVPARGLTESGPILYRILVWMLASGMPPAFWRGCTGGAPRGLTR